MNENVDYVAYLDRHFASADWLTQDVWFQVRKRLKYQEEKPIGNEEENENGQVRI